MDNQTNLNCGVYTLTHLESGAVYVGGSSHVPTRNFSHLYKLARGRHENSTIQALYDASPSGNSAFECAMIECCNRDDLVEREQFWIDALKPYASEVGRLVGIVGSGTDCPY
ncbi:GIY-YIG nuclease family protein [Sinorhizobium fredii]|uniref:GIY-YIG nuclease family protein n=1 Tax=Rhizobium fredii TaxID=380 RepID=UPI0009B6C79D